MTGHLASGVDTVCKQPARDFIQSRHVDWWFDRCLRTGAAGAGPQIPSSRQWIRKNHWNWHSSGHWHSRNHSAIFAFGGDSTRATIPHHHTCHHTPLDDTPPKRTPVWLHHIVSICVTTLPLSARWAYRYHVSTAFATAGPIYCFANTLASLLEESAHSALKRQAC
jgi:hypothetical protein